MNLFEATAKLTLDVSEYEKNVKEAIKQAQKLSEVLTGTSTKSQVASRNFGTLTDTLSRIVTGNKQTQTSTEQVTRSITNSGASAETASKKFSLFGISAKDSSEKVSLFGEMLKANLLSEAISKGFDMIVDGFKAMGSAATGFVKDAVQVGMSFDSSMSQVAATMGMTVSEMESQVATVGDFTGNLREFAEKMGAETAFSAVQAADALNYMALAGYDAEKSMNMLPNVLNLASAGGMDLANASDMVTDAASALGLTTEQTTEMVDKMAMASSKSNTSVSQLGNAILTVGGTAKNLAGGTTELATVLGILADNGIKGSEGGTALRNMILSLSAPTNEAKKQLDELGVSVFDSAGNMRNMNDIFLDMNAAFSQMTQQGRTEAISNIFNKRDLKSVEALLANVGDRYAELSGYIDNAAGSAGEMAKTQLDNLKGDVTIMQSALEGLKISISNEVSPTLRGFAQFAGDTLSKLTKAIKRNGLSGVRGILPTIVRNAVDLLKSKIPQFAKASIDVLKAMGEAIAKNADLIAESINDVTKEVSDYFLKKLPDFVKNGAKIVSGIAKGISGNLAIIIPAVTEAGLTIIDELTKPDQITAFIDSGIEIITALGEGLSNAIPVLVERVPEIVDNIKQGLSDNKEKLEDSAISLITFLGESLKTKASEIKEKAPEIMQKVADKLKDSVPDMLETGKEIIKKLGNAILNADIPMVDKLAIEKKLATLFEKFDTVKMNLEIAVKDVPDEVQEQWKLFTDTLSESFGKVKTAWDELKTTLNIDEFWKSGEAGEQTGKALSTVIEGLGATISVTAGTIGTAIEDILKLFNWLIDDEKSSSLKNALGAIAGGIVAVNTAIAGATFIGMLSNLPALIAGVTGAFSGLWAVMLSNPVLVVVGAIGAIVGALITAYNTNDEFRQKVDETFQRFKESWDKITTGENGFITNIKKFNKDLENFGAGVYDVVQIVKGYLDYSADEWAKTWEKVDKFGEDIDNFISGIEDSITEFVDKAEQWGEDFVDNVISGIDEKINPLHDAGMKIGETLYDLLHHSTPEKGLLKNDNEWMPDMMDNFISGIRDNIPALRGQAENAVSAIQTAFASLVTMGNIEEISVPEIPTLPEVTLNSRFSGFDVPQLPEFETEDIRIEVTFLDNLKELLDKFRSFKDSAIDTDFSMEIPDMVQRIDYSQASQFQTVPAQTAPAYATPSQQTNQITVQGLTIQIDGGNLKDESDVEDFVERLIPIINEKLDTLEIRSKRALGGTGL